jgi:hypothetical protein
MQWLNIYLRSKRKIKDDDDVFTHSLRNEVGSASILETSKLVEEYSRLLVLLGKAESEAADDYYIHIPRTQLKLAEDRIVIR